jgi:hypothetical protein
VAIRFVACQFGRQPEHAWPKAGRPTEVASFREVAIRRAKVVDVVNCRIVRIVISKSNHVLTNRVQCALDGVLDF